MCPCAGRKQGWDVWERHVFRVFSFSKNIVKGKTRPDNNIVKGKTRPDNNIYKGKTRPDNNIFKGKTRPANNIFKGKTRPDNPEFNNLFPQPCPKIFSFGATGS